MRRPVILQEGLHIWKKFLGYVVPSLSEEPGNGGDNSGSNPKSLDIVQT